MTMMNLRTAIGLDIGRSAVKAVAFSNGQRYELVFPSIVARATQIYEEGERVAAELETVEVSPAAPGHNDFPPAGPVRYFTGEVARLHGNASSTVGLHNDWVDSPEYAALVKSAKKRFAAIGVEGLDNAIIVVGTPSKLFQNQRGLMQGATYAAWPGTIKVLSQPMGAYLSFLLDENGNSIKERMIDEEQKKRSWAVIDIGHYTTDFLSLKEGVNQNEKAESCAGISVAVNNLQRSLMARGIKIDLLKGEKVLRERKVKYMGEYKTAENDVDNAVRPVAEAIIQQALSIFAESVGDLDGILLAGGAADIVYSQLHAKWAHTRLLENARMAIAEGYCRYAQAAAKEQAKQAFNKAA